MQKVVFALIALAVCALAASGSIKPKFECSIFYTTNITMVNHDTGVNMTFVTDTKIMHKGDMVYIYQNSTDVATSGLIRCDLHDAKGNCYSQVRNLTDNTCKEDSDIPEPISDDEFFYDSDEGAVDCPYEGITGCHRYCNSTEDLCVIFDSEMHAVQLDDADEQGNFNFTYVNVYHGAASVEDFAGKKCDDKTELPVPEDICLPKITPVFECAVFFTTNYKSQDKDGVITEHVVDNKIMHTDDMLYMLMNSTDINFTELTRCDDKKEGKCYTKLYNITNETDPECTDDYEEPDFDLADEFWYDSDEEVECPYEGISGCHKYCNSTNEECATYDSTMHLIVFEGKEDENSNFTAINVYHPEGCKVEDFVANKCNESSGKLPDPVDICAPPQPSSSSAVPPGPTPPTPSGSSSHPAPPTPSTSSSSTATSSQSTPSGSSTGSASAVKAAFAVVAAAVVAALF